MCHHKLNVLFTAEQEKTHISEARHGTVRHVNLLQFTQALWFILLVEREGFWVIHLKNIVKMKYNIIKYVFISE